MKNLRRLRPNLISTKVSASHRKSTQVDASPGQTKSQVDPSPDKDRKKFRRAKRADEREELKNLELRKAIGTERVLRSPNSFFRAHREAILFLIMI